MKILKSGYISIAEACTALKVSIDTIRRWEKKGLIKAKRDHAGHRIFDAIVTKIKDKTAMEKANQALSYIYFIKNEEKFQKKFPQLEIVHTSIFGNYLRFIISGGLNFRKILPDFLISLIKIIENILFPLKKILGLHYLIVIRKTS